MEDLLQEKKKLRRFTSLHKVKTTYKLVKIPETVQKYYHCKLKYLEMFSLKESIIDASQQFWKITKKSLQVLIFRIYQH